MSVSMTRTWNSEADVYEKAGLDGPGELHLCHAAPSNMMCKPTAVVSREWALASVTMVCWPEAMGTERTYLGFLHNLSRFVK